MNGSKRTVASVLFGMALLPISQSLAPAQTVPRLSPAPSSELPTPALDVPAPPLTATFPPAGVSSASRYGGGYGVVALGDLPGLGGRSRRDYVPPLVLDFTGRDPFALQQMEEDLTVMSHLVDQALERGLGEESPPSKMGVPLLYTSSGRSARGMYLDGFGALFMVKINIPLLAPPSVTQAKTAKPIDSDWEAARREVLGAEAIGDTLVSIGSDTPYDSEQVDALKRNLIDALKNASNIRHLKADDYVALTVFGPPTPITAAVPSSTTVDAHSTQDQNSETPSAGSKSSSVPARAKTSKRSVNSTAVSGKALNVSSPKGTVLTLRAKQADIAALATGKMSNEEFASKVTVRTYSGGGYAAASLNSWARPK